MIALAADEIVMDPGAVLGPVDPQLGSGPGQSYPAVSILRALEEPNPNRSDDTLIMADMARKAMQQTFLSVRKLLTERLGSERADEVAHQLTDGQWTHDYAITLDHARGLRANGPLRTAGGKEPKRGVYSSAIPVAACSPGAFAGQE
jgi:ClpP class serine protease